jgi:hypothetical protein
MKGHPPMNHPTAPAAITRYGHLTVEIQSDSRPALTYLGYPLHLSPDEFRLLRVLLTSPDSPTDPQGYVPATEVLNAMRKDIVTEHDLTDEAMSSIFFGESTHPSRIPYSVEQIANLATRINRKATAIGGRKLILGKSHHGYRLNPYM